MLPPHPRSPCATTVRLGLALALLLGGCGREPGADATVAAVLAGGAAPTGALAIRYPQDGTLFPPEIVAPTLVFEDATEGVDRWWVVVRDDEGGELLRATVAERRFRPAEDDWRRIKAHSRERDAEVVVAGVGQAQPGRVLSSARIRIRTSQDPVGDALFYREVPLPFLEAVQDPSRIRWRYGTVDMEEGPPIVLQNLPVCGNCHSFADDGKTLGLDVDYGNDKGAYAIMDVSKHMVMDDAKIITWADFERADGEQTFGLLSRVSPTGRYVVSTVKDRSVFVALPDLMMSQLFFPVKGILVVYDRELKTFRSLPGADDPKYVQSNPVWSPDGKEIVFARATAYAGDPVARQGNALLDPKAVPEFTVDKQPFRFDLYRVPFRDGNGGSAEPIPGASGGGKSNYFPKFSPDGKWIVFCKADSYMLLQLDSELWIMPATGGEARRLRYNTPRMNSWHSWSSNSRWLVFSSKVNGPYTQLFLTHIDEEGHDSPPVLLERFTSPDRAANIPEFARQPGDAIAEIKEQFLDAYSFLRAGMANERTGDYKGAERAFRRGLAVAPDHAELRNSLGWALFQDGRPAEAVPEYERALALDPKQGKAHNNLALSLVELGRLGEAEEHFRASLAIDPRAEIHSDLGFVLARQGRLDDARAEYAKALALDPDCASAHFNIAVTALQAGALDEAELHYRKALPGRPTAATHNGLGYVLARQGREAEAIEEFRAAVAAEPGFAPAWNNLGEALARRGQLEEAAEAFEASLAQQEAAGVHEALAAVLEKMGRTEQARRELEKGRALAEGE